MSLCHGRVKVRSLLVWCGGLLASSAPEPEVAAAGGVGSEALQDGEIIILEIRPSMVAALVRPAALVLLAAAFGALGFLFAPSRSSGLILLAGSLGVGGLTVLAHGLDLGGRRYVLTDRRVLTYAGPVRGVVAELPLAAVRRLSVTGLRRARRFGLGDLLFHHDGSVAVRWEWIARPRAVRDAVEDVIQRYARGDYQSE